MGFLYQTVQNRDYDWNFLITEELKRNSCRRFDFLKEPNKYLSFGQSTYSDQFGPKSNFPPPCSTGPISMPLVCDRAKHLISTSQQDYDGRRIGSIFKQEAKSDLSNGALMLTKSHSESPEEILHTIGPVPLVKTCRRQQEWETTYGRDYEYIPPKERLFPFPL